MTLHCNRCADKPALPDLREVEELTRELWPRDSTEQTGALLTYLPCKARLRRSPARCLDALQKDYRCLTTGARAPKITACSAAASRLEVSAVLR